MTLEEHLIEIIRLMELAHEREVAPFKTVLRQLQEEKENLIDVGKAPPLKEGVD